MTTIKSIHTGNLDVHDSVTLNGVVTGDATVHPGGELFAHGIVNGTLHVLEGGEADVTGRIGGGYRSHGGKLTIAVGANVKGRMLDGEGHWVQLYDSRIDSRTPRFLVKDDGSLEAI